MYLLVRLLHSHIFRLTQSSSILNYFSSPHIRNTCSLCTWIRIIYQMFYTVPNVFCTAMRNVFKCRVSVWVLWDSIWTAAVLSAEVQKQLQHLGRMLLVPNVAEKDAKWLFLWSSTLSAVSVYILYVFSGTVGCRAFFFSFLQLKSQCVFAAVPLF